MSPVKHTAWLCPLLVLLVGCAPLVNRVNAPPQPEDGLSPQRQLLARIAEGRPSSPVPGVMNGESVIVDYTPSDTGTCGTALVTYQNLTYSETWEVCPGGKLSRVSADAESIVKHPEFTLIRHAVNQGAWKFGQAQAVFADYDILAGTVGAPDARGCLIIETIVMHNARPVDVRHERICGEQ